MAWVLVHDGEDDGRHMYSIKSPVDDMPDTSPEEPTPVEQSVISQAITALNSAVDTTTQKAQEASESADRAEQAAEGVEGYAERAEAAQSASESARDRATQAETSARTSAATATEKASEAISSATTASQSALTAENASDSAQASADASYQNAQAAYRYAQDSATSAGQAGDYANSAGGYSQTASQKASEASQSASTAVQAKTDAENAKQASETAQGRAETARNESVSAKTGAESARDEAQEIVDGITGKVEQIDSNTERIESLEDDRYKPYPTDTASGSIASFSDGADDIPLKSCIVRVEPVQAGSGDPSPENERPITGWTGCEVQRTEVNIWDEELKVGAINSDGSISTATSRRTTSFIPVVGGAEYCLSAPYPNRGRGAFYDAGKNLIEYYSDFPTTIATEVGGGRYKTVFDTPNNARYFRYTIAERYGTTYNHDISINYPSTDSSYHPYTGQTYPITFPSEAGTVYGAYVDVTGGELVVTHAEVDMGTLAWAKSSGRGGYFWVDLPLRKIGSALTSSLYPYYRTRPATYASASVGLYQETLTSDKFVDIYDPSYSDVAEIVSVLNGQQLVYELAEPIHYPLTPTEIKTLLGTNNIWSNTGDVSVEYRADTTLYIKRLTESDTDMVADANITSGSYFMVGNDLYKATVNIASGASVIVGTNATKVSLAQALNEINA